MKSNLIVMNLNHEAFHFINSGLSNPFFDAIMPPISDFGGLVWLSIILVMLLLVCRKNLFGMGKYRRLVRLCIASLLLCVVITSALKLAFNFPRPSLVLSHVNQLTQSVDPTSFPSGHTACSLSVMSVLFIRARDFFKRYRLMECLIIVFSVLIAFSRIYTGMHFPLDVIVGALIGITSGAVICWRLKV